VTVAFLDLSRNVAALRPEIDRAFGAVLDSGRFVLGDAVDAFESAFADYCGARFAVGVGSGTDAISIALRAVGVEAGDEVVTAANTCVPTVAGIEAAGARAVLVDADPETYTLDPGRLKAAVSERTRAIVPVHLYGQCADMDAILAVARARGLKVVEDAAHGHGAEYGGRRAGALADAAAFSFYPTKNLGALGDGGAVVTNDLEVAERARLLRNHGDAGSRESIARGANSRLDALQAAVLRAKLARLEGWLERRREIAAGYRDAMRGLPLALPVEASGRRHAYHLFVVRVGERDRFRSLLDRDGVETLVHYPLPVHRHPAYRDLAHGDLGTSERLADEVVSLPLYAELRDEEAAAVAAAVAAALEALAPGR
jgi:dTDP-3-amino-3,6-dideoxy-alpha-D-glucopyranose transaminase